ncbi:hypothetical protein QO259_17225 [Salinicola sp. JS01]|uniref:hypothetical protein n=1 Tax=Salinicola sp. JS01 TaxID=3050071 RepID=UPI00255BAC80|nr:hypothetical protein [Salinicola sp. JS01]WIX32530.1 hypothetical protein QO259_17225 [Salinicola sp. JS01]
MADIRYQETMWAEMKPDIYGGESCDQHVPAWECKAEGDMDVERGLKDIEFSASAFPPGTKIVVSLPCCPDCGLDAGFSQNGACECGFDWKAWAEERYQ